MPQSGRTGPSRSCLIRRVRPHTHTHTQKLLQPRFTDGTAGSKVWNHQRAGSSPPSPQSEDTNTAHHSEVDVQPRTASEDEDGEHSGLTGASPGHSYTVKSPSSFSSSVDAPESGTLGSSLCLQKVTGRRSEKVTESQKSREGQTGAGWGHLLLHGEHLLLLVLVVEHLGAVCQPLVPRLENTSRRRNMSSSSTFM